MTSTYDRAHPVGFHEGELAVQRASGVAAEAARLSGMLDPADLSGGAATFLAAQTFAVLSGRDRRGRLWTSALTGAPGFLEATAPRTLVVRTAPPPGDPLWQLPAEQQVGLIAIDPARRRRYRVNGWLETASATPSTPTLVIEADEAYGNCPQFIQQRDLVRVGSDTVASRPGRPGRPGPQGPRGDALSAEDAAQVRAADTFFLGTSHPGRGADSSHRGGPPGFVRVTDARHLWWPDYPGNNMFNSLGNLAADPSASLLFTDFDSGRTLHLSGSAVLERTPAGVVGDDGGTGRRVAFAIEQVRLGPTAAVRADRTAGYPRNPALTDQ